MLGLQKTTVQVVVHHPEWDDLFEQERRWLHQQIGHLVLDIQHVGSTAVPGLDAKPILDIAVALASVAVTPQCIPRLCCIGYLDRGNGGANGGYLMVKESAPEVRTHHVHMVTIDDPQWRNFLRFRDRLRADARLRTQYAKLKQDLQRQFAQDRQSYTAAKHDFIRSVLRQ
jgi:GrpB-like predicted nucleotidyltransferase (UPF0157 family)